MGGTPPEAGREPGSCCRPLLGVFCLLLLLLPIPLAALLESLGNQAGLALHKTQEDTRAAGAPGPRPPTIPAPLPHRTRRRRYTITPGRLRWDHFNLTYKILSYPRNLINESETRRGLAAAFRMWSEVSPFNFKEVPRSRPSDLKIGFYPINHTDCLVSLLHHCFDGTTGELAHAFFPPNGEIHFDDSEYWIVGNTRFSWKKAECNWEPTRGPSGTSARPWERRPESGTCSPRVVSGLDRRGSRRVAHGPGPRGGPRDRPRSGPHAFPERQRADAHQRHADGQEDHFAGRDVGHPSALRLPGQAPSLPVMGSEGFVRLAQEVHEEILPQQL
ncbi:matrix metalloproteinase-23 isoform X2 [Tachyglossus aculeatus]|uniref:matrix metalloproteinase-23 isoform X2 n=1 Tax=Tachyglossus aculeatus TaxID=9261 RepID=UPI0018F75A84|nr:matrix metalloproteinase-23 isoform X2 [Tachyglossus aculeatus]